MMRSLMARNDTSVVHSDPNILVSPHKSAAHRIGIPSKCLVVTEVQSGWSQALVSVDSYSSNLDCYLTPQHSTDDCTQ